MNTSNICAVIPAKGNSERTPSKNRQLILGVPLFLWAANNLTKVLAPHQIYVDSDDDTTLGLALRAGYRTIRRPSELATNATDGNALMRWAAQNVSCDVLVQHMATMPFLLTATLRSAISSVQTHADSAVGMMEEALYLWDEDGPTYDQKHVPNSFSLKPTRVESMGLYVTKHSLVLQTGLRFPGRVQGIPVNRFEAIDIDTPHDLEFARVVAAGLPADSEYLQGIVELRERIA